MPDLSFQVDRVQADLDAAAPQLAFRLRIANVDANERVESIVLRFLLQFSGTVFHSGAAGLQVAIIPWDREAGFRLPVGAWRQMMDAHYPNSAWLRLRKDTFDRLHAFKLRNGLATWEQALDRLLAAQAEADRPPSAAALRERLSSLE